MTILNIKIQVEVNPAGTDFIVKSQLKSKLVKTI